VGRGILFLFLLLSSLQVSAQKVQVSGYFSQDSAQLGERVAFILKASYPQSAQLIFPDSTFDFAPFVFLPGLNFKKNGRRKIWQYWLWLVAMTPCG
jgi:hypothetical protein